MKHNLKIISLVLFVELIIGLIWFWVFQVYYDKFTKATSFNSEKVNFSLKEVNFNYAIGEEIVPEWNSELIIYNGIFWRVEINKNLVEEESKYEELTSYIYDINKNNIIRHLYLLEMNKYWILDEHIIQYFQNLEIPKLNKEMENLIKFLVLTKLKSFDEFIHLPTEIEERIQNCFKDMNQLISLREFKSLGEYMRRLEEEMKPIFSLKNETILKNSFFEEENVKYVLNKIYDEKYITNIEKYSELFGIEKELLVSAISVEQLRYLATQRGYTKNLIKQNKYLTNFTQFSFWLWGIKVPTARKIYRDIQIFNIEFYTNEFKNDSLLWDDALIQELIKIDGGVKYASALLYNILERWKGEGYPINNDPGIIITLYNFGNPDNKKPHWDPQIGGSEIKINDEKYLFWEIGHMFYYYLKYYIN